MKTRIIIFLLCLISINMMGQGTVSRQKCRTCGKVVAQCQYKGKHPKPKQEAKPTQKPKTSPKQNQAATQQQAGTASKPTKPAVKTCEICAKPLTQCDFGGKHPYCQTCGKLKERCEHKGEHPVCQTCGLLKDKCEYKGEHPDILAEIMRNMVYVEGGTFTMGATAEQKKTTKSEKPTHSVTLSSFYIGKYEVTQSLWKAVMGSNPSHFEGDNLPVENVSWNDCQTFLRKLNAMTGKNFRLPTEAEWEFAARGGNRNRGYQYSGSNVLSDVAWYADNSGSKTHNVGAKAPNELGIYDMSGNVWEWCQDWKKSYSSSPQTNPKGPSSGSSRVYRGGSWFNFAWSCRVACRYCHTPDYRYFDLGFRLALSQ